MIDTTEKALEQILKLREEEGHTIDHFLRIEVKGGGCSGMTYDLTYDTNFDETKDRLFEKEGINIVTNIKSLLYIMDTELDYTDGLNGNGFSFNNPNATRTCGCGESFSV